MSPNVTTTSAVCIDTCVEVLRNILQLGALISGSQNEERLNMISSRYYFSFMSSYWKIYSQMVDEPLDVAGEQVCSQFRI